MPIKEIIEQPLYYLKCPSTPLVLSHGELQLRLNRLSGKFLAISTFVESGDSYAAVIPTSSIIAALANDPRQFFWKGYLNAAQPSSYGITQPNVIDPEFRFEITNQTELYDNAFLPDSARL